ncbi:MAG: DoxX family protein [Betaproteobacteria bacterium]|nr:DoxX family protein [Betaproteobacteria bacterium]
MNENTKSWVLLVSRLLVGSFYILAGVRKILAYTFYVGYMTKTGGMPIAEVFLPLTILLEIGGGLMIIFGWKFRIAAWALLLFTLVATFIFHQYWTFEAALYGNQLNHFFKNMSILAGFAYMAVFGPGAMSLDARGARPAAK